MEHLPETLEKTAQLINQQLGISLSTSAHQNTDLVKTDAYEELVKLLTPFIQTLLNDEFEKLLQLMYRIDIPESGFNQALGQANPGDIAPQIARLVIDRQLQKIKIREKYSEK